MVSSGSAAKDFPVLMTDPAGLDPLIAAVREQPFSLSPPMAIPEDGSVLVGLFLPEPGISTCIRIPSDSLDRVMGTILSGGDRPHVFVHSLKQMIRWFADRNVVIPLGRLVDVSVGAYLLSPPERDLGEDFTKFTLASLVHDHLGKAYPFLPYRVEELDYPEILHERVYTDARYIWSLGERILDSLKCDESLLRLFFDVELPLIPVLSEMERAGMALEKEKIAKAGPRVDVACKALSFRLRGISPDLTDPFSEEEVRGLLRVLGFSSHFARNTIDDDYLKGLSRGCPPIVKLLAWRRLERVRRFFEGTGNGERCFPTWWQTRTSTGRIVCTEPALQNLPKSFRRYLSPGKGNVFIKADYSAFQLRLLADLSGDERLTEVFRSGGDPHGETMNRLRNRGLQVTRSMAKEINFLICYRGTAWSLASRLGVSVRYAAEMMKEFKNIYPRIGDHLDGLVKHLESQPPEARFVRSPFGRRRCFNCAETLSMREKRQAENSVVQMFEADVFKTAVLKLDSAFKSEALPVKIAFLLHDGIWFTCPADDYLVAKAKALIREVMEGCVNLSVPLVVDVE